MKMRVRGTGDLVELPPCEFSGDCCPENMHAWKCTLNAGHVGPHVAHGTKLPITFWHDGDTYPTLVDPLEPTP